jgi:hypothetical protein
MSRVIRVDGPGKLRTKLMRTGAEVIRHLSQKAEVDDEARDMAALLVYCFREIDDGIDETVRAWEKRDYWVKAERFRLRWSWAGQAAGKLERIVVADQWEQLPPALIELLPQFEDIKIAKFTRKPSLWRGSYDRLMKEHTRKSNGNHSKHV